MMSYGGTPMNYMSEGMTPVFDHNNQSEDFSPSHYGYPSDIQITGQDVNL